MHVCMVSNCVPTILPEPQGAINSYVFELSKKLSQWNHVTLFGRGSGSIDHGNFKVQSFSYGFPLGLSKYKVSDLAYSSLYMRYLIPRVQKINHTSRVDIVHVHDIFDTPFTEIIKGTTHVKTVCSIHNIFRAPLLAGHCDRILANSVYMKNFLINQGHLDRRKIDVLPIAVDVNVYKPTMKAKERCGLQGYTVVLFIGRKIPYKGPQVLVDALPKICQSFPKTLAVLLGPDNFFGSRSVSYSAFLKERARKLGVENNIILKSFVCESDLLLYLNAADILVCPSIWQEPFGKVVIEANACEKAVVATNVGGLPELVKNGKNGLLIPPNDSRSIEDAVISLLRNKVVTQSMGKNGRKIVESTFSYDTVSTKCQRIYETTLND